MEFVGSPSSLAVAVRVATAGKVISWSPMMFTTGAPSTVMVTSLVLVARESLADKRSTYTPVLLKVTLVDGALLLPKTARPGPLCWLHVIRRVPDGKPSSNAVPLKAAWRLVTTCG